MEIVKIIILILSLIGYYLLFQRKVKLKEEFIPIVVIVSISLIMFIAFILNIAILGTILITLAGLIFLVKSVYEMIKNKEKPKINFNIIFLAIFVIWAAIILKGTILIHYDNFSHWGMIAREMLITDKLPNFESTTIMFTSYPPGTACTIYFFCKFLGSSESRMLFAQSLIIISSLYTLFAFCNKNKKINYIIALIAIIYMIIGNIFITELLVDTVLPVLGLAAFAIIIYYRNDTKKALIYSIPILSYLIIVKNSGIFFVVIDLLVYFAIFIKKHGLKNIFKTKYLLLILIPVALQIIWSAHTDLVFSDAANSKHAMTVENYESNMEKKNETIIKTVAIKMFQKMTDINNSDNIILLAMLGIFVFMLILPKNKSDIRKFILKMLSVFIVTYIVYQIGLFGMYLLSMPEYEAINLSAYSRYFKTMVMFNYGITIIAILMFLDRYKISKTISMYTIQILIVIIASVPIILYSSSLKKLYTKPDIKDSTRTIIINYKNAYEIEEKKSYLIYVSEHTQKDYLYYICKYDFRSTNIKIITSLSELKDLEDIEKYNYFIILDKNDEILKYLENVKGDIKLNVIKNK